MNELIPTNIPGMKWTKCGEEASIDETFKTFDVNKVLVKYNKKSYNIPIKFESKYSTDESIFNNVYKPMFEIGDCIRKIMEG